MNKKIIKIKTSNNNLKRLSRKNSTIGFVPFILTFVIFSATFLFITSKSDTFFTPKDNTTNGKSLPTSQSNDLNKEQITPTPLLSKYEIPMKKHMFQSFNNCGPATLSMALSYIDIDKSQEELGQLLRPYQVAGGNNDDKSVTLNEVSNYAKSIGLNSYLRPNGNITTIKKFVSNGIPVITRTWLTPNEDIGHYRVVRGFDDGSETILQDDSYQDKNLTFGYQEFLEIWKPFNYEYLVIVDDSKKELAEKLLGEELDEKVAWQNALGRIQKDMATDENNVHLTFAKARIYHYLGDHQKSVEVFNKVQDKLSFRTLWYQLEPLASIYEIKDYERLFSLSENILNNQNRAYSELYVLRAKSYLKKGDKNSARKELENAVFYNRNLKEANLLLSTI